MTTDAPPEKMTNAELDALEALAKATTPGRWRSMRDGNQYLGTPHDVRHLVGASRVDGLPRVWNHHYVVSPIQLEHVSRFTDADADYIEAVQPANILRFIEAARRLSAPAPAAPRVGDALSVEYLDQMQAHVDEGGQLNHRNGVDLLCALMATHPMKESK